MRTDNKKSLKDKKSATRDLKQPAAGYSKKATLLEEAITQMNAGKYGRSSSALKELLAMDPHNMEARRLFATLHLRLGSLIPARQAFDSLIDEAFGRQDFWLAESLLREYLAAGPRCVPYLEKLGSIFQDKGETLQAVAEYGKAIEILIEDPDPDNPNHASQLYQKITSIAPGSPIAYQLANCFDRKTGELIVHAKAAEAPHSASTEDASVVPTDTQPANETVPWEQSENSSPVEEFAVLSPSSDMPSDVSALPLQQEEAANDGNSISSDSVMPEYAAASYESEAAQPISGDSASFAPQEGEVSDGLPQDMAQETTADPVPYQTGAEPSEVISSMSAPDQPQPSLTPGASTGGDISWDSVFKIAWNAGGTPTASPPPMTEPPQTEAMPVAEATASTISPSYEESVEPGAIEIPEADSAPWQPDAVAAPADAPMPWDQVQASASTISQPQAEETVAEPPFEQAVSSAGQMESVAWSYQEPVSQQNPPPVVDLPTSDAAETDVFSLVQSSPAPSPFDTEPAPAGAPPIISNTEYRDAGMETEQQPSTFSYAGEATRPVEPEALAPVWAPPDLSPPVSEPVASETYDKPTAYSLNQGAAESESTSSAVVSEPAGQGFIQQEEWNKSTFTEVAAPLSEPTTKTEEWNKSGEAIRFLEKPAEPPATERAAQNPLWGGQTPNLQASPAAAAVDVLFEQSGRSAETETREHTARPRTRPKSPGVLSRIGTAASDFLGTCFSTTRAIVMSLIGLAVFACIAAALGIGAVGLTWIVMEESPSPAYHNFTAVPPQALSDPNKNGYLLLLGFDVPPGQDPVQAGYDRTANGKDADRVLACLGGAGDGATAGDANAPAKVLSGWFRGLDPVGQFRSNQGVLSRWVGQGEAMLSRYKRWQGLPFEDWGYGQAAAPACASINFAHHLYVAEGFAQQTDIGIDRLETDMEAWRIVLAQAKTLPVKTLAIQAIRDDAAVASGLMARPDFDGKYVGRLSKMVRPLSQAELSIRWPMQSELAWAAKTFDAQLKAKKGEGQSRHAAIASALPLPKQRRLNGYAAYYEASYKAVEEGQFHSALPKWGSFIKYPAAAAMDYMTNPIENVIGLDPLPPWDVYNGLAVDADAHLRLASLQAWIRRGLPETDLLTRIAKAGQIFYDPYTGMPMLANLKKRVLYSVGHDGKDQDGDLQYDVVVAIPANLASAAP